jgi:hypothetical protein
MGEGVVVRPDQVSLGVLVSVVSRDAVDVAVARYGVGAKRSDGKLPAQVTAYLTMALWLFADDDYEEVATKVTGSLSRRSKLPELVHQEIWAWPLVHYALSALLTQAAEAADLDPDRISFTRVLRIARRTATGTAGIPPEDWEEAKPHALTNITRKIIKSRRHRTCPRAVKRARHNSYRVKQPGDTSTRHPGPPTINVRRLPQSAA